jgi:hypothetical protein
MKKNNKMKKFMYRATFKRATPDAQGRTEIGMNIVAESHEQYVLNDALCRLMKKSLAEKIGEKEAEDWSLTDCECQGEVDGRGRVIVTVNQAPKKDEKPVGLTRNQKVWVRLKLVNDKANLCKDVQWVPAVATGEGWDVMLSDGSVLTDPSDPENDIRLWEDNPYATAPSPEPEKDVEKDAPDVHADEDDDDGSTKEFRGADDPIMIPVKIMGVVDRTGEKTARSVFYNTVYIPDEVFVADSEDEVSLMAWFENECNLPFFRPFGDEKSRWRIISACVQGCMPDARLAFSVDRYNEAPMAIFGDMDFNDTVHTFRNRYYYTVTYTYTIVGSDGRRQQSMPQLVAVSPYLIERDFYTPRMVAKLLGSYIHRIQFDEVDVIKVSKETGAILDIPIIL